MKKTKFTYLIIIILATALLIHDCQKQIKTEPLVRPVKSMVIGKAKNRSVRIFPGKILAATEADLSFKMQGRLIQLPVEEGNIVATKQLLAHIDPRNYEDSVKEAYARLAKAKAEFIRAKKLIKGDFISRSEYDSWQAAYNVRLAKYNTAKKNLSDTYIYAPFPGYISTRHVDNFEHVKANQTIITLQDKDHVDAEIDVAENIVIHLKGEENNVKINAIFEALPNREFPMKFKKFAAEADPETQTYRITFTMPKPKDINIFPGMTVNVKTTMPNFENEKKQFHTIPSSAVFADKQNKTFVWVINPTDKTVKLQPVKITTLSSDQVQVISGIKTGERIVISGVHFLQKGQKVRPLKTDNNDASKNKEPQSKDLEVRPLEKNQAPSNPEGPESRELKK